jgi:hypothetical protein
MQGWHKEKMEKVGRLRCGNWPQLAVEFDLRAVLYGMVSKIRKIRLVSKNSDHVSWLKKSFMGTAGVPYVADYI